jgi:uncharacterized protein
LDSFLYPMKKLLVFGICCILSLPVYAQYTVQSVPNQKLIDNSYVSNPDKILDESTVAQIDSMLMSLEETSTAQVAVVAVESIGDADIFDFAQQLFNSWGIGNANDNGLLILLVEDKRTIRFHTGDGLEGVLPDATCKQIQREFMVPEFKNGNYSAGVLAGIIEVNNILTNPAYAEEVKAKAPEEIELSDYTAFLIFMGIFFGSLLIVIYAIKALNGKFSNSKKQDYTLYPEMRFMGWQWVMIFGGVPLLILIYFGIGSRDSGMAILSIYGYYLLTAIYKLIRSQKVIRRFSEARDYYQVVEFLRKSQWYWLLAGVLFPIPFAAYFFYHLFRKRIYRNHSRQCRHCNNDMRKLNENDDDAFLTKNKLMEENLRSVDYDVWQCASCSATEEWNYPRRTSKYKACPYCDTKAYYLTGRKTTVSATYSSQGYGEETHSCKFCGKSKKEKYTIAQLQRSSSSSGGSSFSSSSGGSWGGGRSGGGGASSSW